jgi:hypothetical protein
MIGMKQFCALLLAGGMGAGSVVTVQQVKPAVGKMRAKPKVQKAVQQARQASSIRDCPSIASLAQGFDVASPLPGPDPIFADALRGAGFGGGEAVAGGGGGGGGFGPGILPGPIPVAPGVPQPDSWVMLVAGFGFLGLALRRRPARPATRDV